MLNLADKDLKTNTRNMFKEIKEDILALTHQLGNIKKQKTIGNGVESVIIELENSLEEHSSRFELAEENNH